MVYLNHITDIQMMFIPKEGRDAQGTLFFKACNTINQFIFSFAAEQEGFSLLYYKVLIQLKDNIPAGEYQYTLSDEAGDLSTGLLVIGELDNSIEYYNETEYEQYEN